MVQLLQRNQLKKNKFVYLRILTKMNIMKIKFLSILLLAAGVTAFGQKKEIRDAEKAVKQGNYDEAHSFLKDAEDADFKSLNKRWQSRYYMAEGDSYFEENKESADVDGLTKAANSYNEADELGDKDAQEKKQELLQVLLDSGIESQNTQDFVDAYKKMEAAYELSPTDTIYLFAAAGNAFNAEDDEEAIKIHERLVDMGYRGDAMQYYAVEKESGEKQAFPDKEQRDLMVKTGQYEDPTDEQDERKDGDIIKQLAVLYLRNDDKEKAIDAIKKAKEANPGDTDIDKAEAQVYLEMGDKDKFVEIISSLVDKDPENAGEYYRILGHAAIENEDYDKAEENYEKAIEKDPKEKEAYNGLANLKLKRQEDIVAEMNDLGMSEEDSEKYDELQEKRMDLLKEAIPYLDKSFELDDQDMGTIRTLYNIHRQLENKEEADKYKALMEN